MCWNVIIFISLIVILYILSFNKYEDFNNLNIPKIDETKKNKLIAALYIFHKLCEKYNVYYIISYGTLLGAVRHWGMIPWDDDIDINVKSEDRKKIYMILNEMRDKYGYQIENLFKLSRVFVDGNSGYFMDIFFMKNIDGKAVRTYVDNPDQIQDIYDEKFYDKNQEWWWNGFDFDYKLIIDRKKFLYEDINVWGPKDPVPVLISWYGKDFLKTCKTHYLKNHNEYVKQEVINCENLPKPQL